MTTIYDFIADPFKAVRAGYRPTYMTCVSAVSHRWFDSARVMFEEYGKFRKILDMTLRSILKQMLFCFCVTLGVLTFPIGIWFWGWIQYLNVQHAIRADERIDALHR